MSIVKITGVNEVGSNEYWVTFEFVNDQKTIEGWVSFKNGRQKKVKLIGKGELRLAERLRVGLKARQALENY